MESLLASFEGIFGVGIGFGMFVVVPLVYLLLAHQRKMTQLLSKAPVEQEEKAKIANLQAEVRELKERVNTLMLQADDRRLPNTPPTLPDRLKSGI